MVRHPHEWVTAHKYISHIMAHAQTSEIEEEYDDMLCDAHQDVMLHMSISESACDEYMFI